MSVNVRICAHRDIVVKETGVGDKQVIHFNALQTPILATSFIMGDPDKIKAYSVWAASRSSSHAEQFKKWVDKVTAEGYEIEFYAI